MQHTRLTRYTFMYMQLPLRNTGYEMGFLIENQKHSLSHCTKWKITESVYQSVSFNLFVEED
jgi:hypothetical protein